MLFMAVLCAAPGISAQEDYRFEAGAGIGMTGYLGDANASNLWRNPGADGEALFRYIINPRFALKSAFYACSLRGNSAQMQDVLPEGVNYKFTTGLYELSECGEFNFFNFGIGEPYRRLRRWTPYITAGLGVAFWTTGGRTSSSLVVPLGAGVKFKLRERLNIGLEFLMKKTFSDRVDGPELSDPFGIESSFAKNTDWYSTLTVTISYEFGRRCATCNYKD